MAKLDLKRCTVKIRDGNTKTGAVNNGAGYASGISTMTVDGFTDKVIVGQEFYVAGELQLHTVTASSPGSGATTSITFTPALDATVADNAVISVLGEAITMKVGEGNLTYTEKKAREYTTDRGALDTVRDADEEPMEVKIDLVWEFLISDTGEQITPYEAIKHQGAAADWETTSTDPCEPYSVDIEVTNLPLCTTGGVKGERITFPDFRYEQIDGDLKAATLSVSGKCNAVEPIIERITQTNFL